MLKHKSDVSLDKKKKNMRCYILLAISIITLINTVAYTHLSTISAFDEAVSPVTFNTIYDGLFTWQPLVYSGSVSYVNSISDVIIYSIIALSGFLGIVVQFNFSIWVYSLIGGIGMFMLVSTLMERYGNFASTLSGIFAFIIFSINFNSINSVSNIGAIFLPFSFYFLYLFILNIKDGKPNLKLFGISSILISITLSFGGAAFLIQDMLLFFLFYLFYISLSGYKNKVIYLKYFLLIVLLSFIIDSSFLLGNYVLLGKSGSNFFNSGTITQIEEGQYTIPISLFTFMPILSTAQFGLNFAYKSTLWDVLFTITAILVFVISILSLYIVFKTKRLNDTSIFTLSLFVCYLIFVILFSTFSPPFGFIFSKITQMAPFLSLFRNTYAAFHPYMLFYISIFFGTSFGYCITYLSNQKKKIMKNVFFVFVVFVLALYIVVNDVGPILYLPSSFIVHFPTYFFSTINFISNIGSYSVATLPIPITSPYQDMAWYRGTNMYSEFINAPVYDGGYSPYGFAPSGSMAIMFYHNISSIMQTTQQYNETDSTYDFINYYKAFGIKYVIVQGEAIRSFDYNISYIYKNLNNSGASFVKRFGNDSIYYINGTAPLIYATNLKNIEYGNVLFNDIVNKSTNITEYSLFANTLKNINFQNSFYYFGIGQTYNTTILPEQITKMSKPNISFSVASPVEVNVKIRNATTPFYLIFRETFDPDWIAYYQNGTVVNNHHIEVNGFANAWYMNKTGNYTISIYYTDQTAINIAWIVSVLGFGISIYLIYLGRNISIKYG